MSKVFDSNILAFQFFSSIFSLSLCVIMAAKRDDSPPPYGIHFRSDGSISASAGFQPGDIHPYTLQLIQALSGIGTLRSGGYNEAPTTEEKKESAKDKDTETQQPAASSNQGGESEKDSKKKKQQGKGKKKSHKMGKKF